MNSYKQDYYSVVETMLKSTVVCEALLGLVKLSLTAPYTVSYQVMQASKPASFFLLAGLIASLVIAIAAIVFNDLLKIKVIKCYYEAQSYAVMCVMYLALIVLNMSDGAAWDLLPLYICFSFSMAGIAALLTKKRLDYERDKKNKKG